MKYIKSTYSKFNAKHIFAGLLFLSQIISAQNPSWAWAVKSGGTGNDFNAKTCTDASGNVYVAGTFQSSSIMIGTVNIANSGISGSDVYVAKYDPNGVVQWAQRIAGANSEYVGGIATDPSGRVYVSGYYTSPTISLPPFNYGNSGGAAGSNDVYVTCINGSGVPQWFQSFGTTAQETNAGLAYSSSLGALYVGGSYNGSVMAVGLNTVANTSAAGKHDVFLVRFTNSGGFTWLRSTGSVNVDEYMSDVSADAAGNPHFMGSFTGSVFNATTTIGPTVLTSYGNTDIFLAKYSSAGTSVWSKNMGCTSNDYGTDIDLDASDNVYVAGQYQGAPINFGTFSINSYGGYDGFMAKYNSTGTEQWAIRAGGTGHDYGSNVAIDATGNAYFSCYFESASCTVGTATLNNVFLGTTDMFVAKYTTGGSYLWNARSTGTANETPISMDIDNVGNIYVAGYFDGLSVLSSNSITSTGNYDGFLAKIGCLTTSVLAPLSVCAGSSATLTATGATTYSWNTGATTSSIVITPTASAVYTATGTTGSCVGTPATVSITLLPASVSAGTNLNLLCKQKAVINATCNPSSTATSWSPTVGLSSASVLNPTVTATIPQTYTLTATLNNGCIKTSTINVSSYAQTPNICMVTVDSLGNNNEIYYDKTLYPQADSFIVYRETSSNIYTRIGGVSRTSLSMYIDTNRSIGPANGNPNLTFYRYKLAIKDSCGNISNKSLYHETIFNQDQQNGNFNWNSYAIESSSTPVSIYNLKRRNLTTGTETLVAATTGNLAIDPSYNTFWPTQTKWFVDAVGFNCNATAKMMVLKTKTKSNQSNDKQFVTSVGSLAFNSSVDVYPNPSRDFININMNALNKTETDVQMVNMLGQVVYETKSLNQHLVINVSEFKQGVYMINIKQNNRLLAVKKVVIE